MRLRCSPQRNDFGMAAGIGIADRTIVSRRYNFAINNYCGTDRNFSDTLSKASLLQSCAHSGNILFRVTHGNESLKLSSDASLGAQ